MAGIAISGLASGINWQTMVTNLMKAEALPETGWKNKQTANTTQITDLDQIQADLQALQTSSFALENSSVFGSCSTSLSGSGWTAGAEPNTATGQYTFKVTALATAAQLIGSTGVSGAINSSANVNGVTISTMNLATPITAGTFTVNGQQVTVNSTDSLQDVFTAISNATQGAVAASYDPTHDTVSLTASSPITVGSAADTSNFLSALDLYTNGGAVVTSTSALGVVNPLATIANANLKNAVTNVDSSGNGSLSINGVSFNFNENTDTLQSIMNNINSSTAGVTIGYNNITGHFTLVSDTTGDVSLSVSQDAGGLLAALGLNGTATPVAGTNAQVQVDNGPVRTSTSNTFDQSVTGIKGLSVTATSLDTQIVTVGNNTSSATSAIKNFISSFNQLQNDIATNTAISVGSSGAVTAAPLSADTDVSAMGISLRNLVFNSIPGLGGTIKSLGNIGVGFASVAPTLSITDSTALTAALQNDPAGVANLFIGAGGIVTQINKFVDNATGPNSYIDTETGRLNSANNVLTNQINALQTKVTSDQTSLTKEFIAMESALGRIQSESETLNAYFGANTNSANISSASGNSSSNSSSSSSSSTIG